MSLPKATGRELGAAIGWGLAFAVTLIALQLLRLGRLVPHSFDLGIYAQGLYSAGQGGGLSSVQQAPLMGVHWSPILFFLAPLGWVFDPAVVLVGAQSLALGATAPLLFLCLRQPLGERQAGWAGALALAYPPLWSLGLADVHPVAFGVPLSLLLYLALQQERWTWPLLAGLALAWTCNEVYPAVLVGVGLWLACERRWAWALGFGGLGLVSFVLIVGVILPWARLGAPEHQGVFYDHLGASPLEVVLSPVLRPGVFFGQLFQARILFWLLGLLAPLVFLPLVRWPLLLPALPALAIHGISARASQQDLAFHYHAPLVPWLLLAAALAFAHLTAERRQRRRGLGLGLGLALAAGLFLFPSALPEPRRALGLLLSGAEPDLAPRRELLRLIPAGAPAVADTGGLHVLSARERLWFLGNEIRGTKGFSEIPTEPPPDEAWIFVDSRDNASFLPYRIELLPKLAEASRRWRALALVPDRDLAGAVEGAILLGPEGEPFLRLLPEPPRPVEGSPEAEQDPRPVLAVTPRRAGRALAGVAHFSVTLCLPDRPVGPLTFRANYLEPNGRPRRRTIWPASYRLLDGRPGRCWTLPLGLLRLPGCEQVRLEIEELGGPLRSQVVIALPQEE